MSVLHVDPVVGDDDDPGTPDAPFRTVAHAVGQLDDGDSLLLSTRAPFPPAVFPAALKGEEGATIRIESAGPGPAVFDGALPTLAQAGNDAWEPVTGGHPDEWRTKEILDAPTKHALHRYGRFADSGHRLLTYSRIGDLRATNESFHRVPLADPRPAGGPLVDDLTRKAPWVYLGPGVVFVFDDPAAESGPGRIHIRLSPTHIDAPGIEDYRGATDPNEVALWIAREDLNAARFGARHVEFRNLHHRPRRPDATPPPARAARPPHPPRRPMDTAPPGPLALARRLHRSAHADPSASRGRLNSDHRSPRRRTPAASTAALTRYLEYRPTMRRSLHPSQQYVPTTTQTPPAPSPDALSLRTTPTDHPPRWIEAERRSR